MKSFGVGCLHFSISDKRQGNITVQGYIDEVVRVLEQLTTVSDIDYSFDEDVKGEEIEVSAPNPQLQNGQPCYPRIPIYNLEFNLYIPFRVQANLINTVEEYVDTGTENFKVYFKHDWYGPLSYIECIDTLSDSSPSTAVHIVREYLSKEIEVLDSFLKADFIGPSPFHADFFLLLDEESKSDESKVFRLEHARIPAYDRLTFRFSRNDFESEDAALAVLMDELSDELAYFYDLKVKDSRRIHEWQEIQETMHSILEFENEDSKLRIKDKFLRRPKLFHKVFRDIGLFRGQDIFDKSLREQHYASIYKSEKYSTYLGVFIDKELSEWQAYPIQETIDLLKYFDQKSSKSFELTIVFIAAVMGGIVGALITVLFG